MRLRRRQERRASAADVSIQWDLYDIHAHVHTRSQPYRAYADDYAFYINALIDLFLATQDAQYLRRAREWQARMNTLFYTDEHRCFYSNDGRDASVLLRLVDGGRLRVRLQ